ncbi:sensor domain-containing protein [Massilia eurypsychrophila]|uniref:sensor domain-containing protein n=1 Tax=Massilia eurypsychrophila TaxID=1485217 RepID=UPI001E2FB6DA|nr:EAL domain-containing protein [Massilia eurypsychrophila]
MEDVIPALLPGAEPDAPGLAALELLYRLVAAVELTPNVAVHSSDRDGVVRYWNRTCAELIGLAPAEALGRQLTSVIVRPGYEGEFAATIAAIWRTGIAPPPREWPIRRADGAERWVCSSHFPVIRDGVTQQVICMELDVTGRKTDELALLRAGADFRRLYERSTDAIVLVRGRRIIDVNPAALRLFGCDGRERMVGHGLADFSPPQQPSGEASSTRQEALAAQAASDGNQRYEWLYRSCGGGLFWAEVLLTSVAIDHEQLSFAVIRDISQRKSTERTLTMAAQVFENCRDAILILDGACRVVAVNQAFTDITGFAPADIIGREVPSLRSGVHEPAFYQEIWDFVVAHDHWEGEVLCVRSNAEEYPVWAALTAIRDGAGKVSNYMAILSDITDRKQVEEHTRHLAEHDFLTDLPNRVLFLDRLQQALATSRRQHTRVAVMFLDLDRFKAINDSYGHQAGDVVLREVAARLTRCVRGVDTVSRQGGDEFVVILADIGGADQAAHVAGSVMHAVGQPMKVLGQEIALSASIGISIFPSDGHDVDTLMRHADVAMYHAKQNGRNAFRFFSPEMNAHVVERVQIENKLRQALANNEFVLEYQPEIDIASGRTIGFEALIRWRHPERGLLQPDQFIPIAEASGLIVPIGAWVLREACAQARAWRDQGCPVVVAVNLSNVQFIHDHLLQYVDDALAASSLAPQFLDLEITEGMIMKGDEATIDTVNALHRRGVQITVDDFGTGCSSLSTLRRYRLSKLKIDRSFIDDIMREPDDAAIIPAIIAVARSLKLRVIAEGVETAEQLRFLQQHGCDEYQGYYASMASSEPDLRRRHP